MSNSGHLLSVHPEELAFQFVLEKQCYCDLKLVNNTEHHIAFKVKTTSPKKYFVRPNTGVIQPWDSCTVTVTLQAQREYPPDMQCKDKFLLQSTKVPPVSDIDEIPPDTFNKDDDKIIEEIKLRVIYSTADSGHGSPGAESLSRSSRSSDTSSEHGLHRLKEERDSALQHNQQLRQELEMLKRRRSRPSEQGFSLTFAVFVGLVGIAFGFLLNLVFSSPPAE